MLSHPHLVHPPPHDVEEASLNKFYGHGPWLVRGLRRIHRLTAVVAATVAKGATLAAEEH